MTVFKLPEPSGYLFSRPGISKIDVWPHGGAWEKLYTAQTLRDVLEQASEVATDAVAFNGGTVQMEAHVREAIRKMIGEIK